MEKQYKKLLEVLKQLHINILLLKTLQQMPNYAKFLKDVITKRRKLGDFKTLAMTTENNILIQHKIPAKMKDPCSFTISCSKGGVYCREDFVI